MHIFTAQASPKIQRCFPHFPVYTLHILKTIISSLKMKHTKNEVAQNLNLSPRKKRFAFLPHGNFCLTHFSVPHDHLIDLAQHLWRQTLPEVHHQGYPDKCTFQSPSSKTLGLYPKPYPLFFGESGAKNFEFHRIFVRWVMGQ